MKFASTDGFFSAVIRADFHKATAQPGVDRVAVHARMPEQRHRDLRDGHRQGKGAHPAAEDARVSFGDGGYKVRLAGKRHCR